MKYIEVDEDLYRFIAGKTEHIGESASDILRRLLDLTIENKETSKPETIHEPSLGTRKQQPKPVVNTSIKSASTSIGRLFNDEELRAHKAAVGRFLFVLSRIYESSPTNFAQVLQIQGRGRLYFATSKEALLASSATSNPKQIAQSGYWVITNNNTAKKRTILNEVFELFNCKTEVAQALSQQIWGDWLNEDGTPKISPQPKKNVNKTKTAKHRG